MFDTWFFVAAGFALIDWVSAAAQWKWIRFIVKGGTLVVLLVWFSLVGGWRGPLFWFGLGLSFCLAGDILLQHSSRQFLKGLSAFLIGHLCYIVGFLTTGLNLGETGLIFGVPYLAACLWIFNQLLRRIRQKPENSKMTLPVAVYGIVISAMVICAGLTMGDPRWSLVSATCCALGGVLFLISDSILALNRFVRQVKKCDLIVMVTYHLAQFLIMIGALLRLA